MAKIKRILLGSTLMLVTGLAIAGTVIFPTLADNAIEFPTCDQAADWRVQDMSAVAEHPLPKDEAFSSEQDSAAASALEEYLSFHAQATEQTSKLLPLPWSRLRTHAN
jgi:hypothetical protein